MLFLNKLKKTIKYKKPKRLGRGIGSGLGKTSGRGHKGQKSRSGYKINKYFEGGQTPFYKRIPKFGFNNIKKNYKEELRLSSLNIFKENSNINLKILKKNKIIKFKTKFVKLILGGKFYIKNINIIDKNIKMSLGVLNLIKLLNKK